MFIRQNFRIYPNNYQKRTINAWLGQARFIWNFMLEKNKEEYAKNQKFLFSYDMSNLLPIIKKSEEFSWLNQIPAQCLQQKCQDLDTALKRKFKKTSEFPKFKSRKTDESGIRFPQESRINKDGKLTIPKLKGIKIVQDRPFIGEPGALTLSKDKCGDYWVSVLVKIPDDYYPEPTKEINRIIGLDAGLKNFLISSDGEVFKNPKFLGKAEKKLRRINRSHSRKTKGGKNREKARLKLAKQHRKILRQRKDHQNKLAVSIAKSNDLICIEDLSIKGLVRNHKVAKSISDVSWSQFFGILEWQCKKRGKNFVRINRWYPSSKTCSSCGSIKEDLTLNDRVYICRECGFTEDRDLNAAINIRREGLKQFNTNKSSNEKMNFSSEKIP